MGLFDFMKTKEVKQETVYVSANRKSTPQTDFEHLTKDGNLPWGWIAHTKEFTEKINNEYSYFLNMWLATRTKSAREQYSALKSLVVYLEDVEKLCKSKGECFEFWFYEVLISKDYIRKRKKELDALAARMDRTN